MNIIFEDLYINSNTNGDCQIYSSDELINLADNIRKANGRKYTIADCDGEMYYNFYLDYDTEKRKLDLKFTVIGGDEDNEEIYSIVLTKEDKKEMMWELIKWLHKNVMS